MNSNSNLNAAKDKKNDEYYTLHEDIESELANCPELFRGKIVYCNCDNPKYSNFWRYFHLNFSRLGLKKLICTYYDEAEAVYKTEYDGGHDEDITIGERTPLTGNGDFASKECIEILRKADIVVTNPPFSKFRNYMDLLIQSKKKFIVIGPMNAVGYKDIFPLIKNREVWLGVNAPKRFLTPGGGARR